VIPSLGVAFAIICDFIGVLCPSRAAVMAENLFLRRQLALYQERKTAGAAQLQPRNSPW
jgi:hypothetical protein